MLETKRTTLVRPQTFRNLTLIRVFVLGFLVAGFPSLTHAVGEPVIDEFTLPDVHGSDVSLSDFAKHRAVVVCFLGTECPLAQFYGPRLQKMSQAFEQQGVAFIGINSNIQDSLTEIKDFSRRHNITFAMLKDLRNQAAEQFGATRTPEVFLLDANRAVRYQGRVDQQYTFGSGVGLAKPNETRADLRIAIEEVLAGNEVSVPETTAKGCLIGRVRETTDKPSVTYSQHISRLVQKHCLQCHREGQIAPFAMETYDDVAGWGDMIAEVVAEQRMPPWHAGEKSTLKFVNDASLSDDEKALIYQWVEDGCPEGDPDDLPPKRQFPEGSFTEGGFDEIIYMAEEKAPVRASGFEEYRYYEVPGFEEDRWATTIECLPGNHSVVHHIIVYARPPGGDPIAPGSTGIDVQKFSWLVGFAPGVRPFEMPDGWARQIPAGYSLVFEMHYTPIGTAQTDRSAIGIVFTERENVDRVLHTSAVLNHKFVIPAGDPNYPVVAEKKFGKDTELLAFAPHMHIRGKSFRYELLRGDESEILLDVPNYDFNWQNGYTLKEPLLIPKGTRMKVTAHFDNSEQNLANPDPTKDIKWGRQSWDEMMIGFYDHGVSIEESRRLLEREAKQLQADREKRKQAAKRRRGET